MATIPKDRIRALGTKNYGGAPEVFLPIAATQTPISGDLGAFSSGYIDFTNGTYTTYNTDPADGTIVGINEMALATAPATGTPVLLTLAMPGLFYEASVNSTTTTSSWGLKAGAIDDSAAGVCVDMAETTTNLTFRILSFPGGSGATPTFITSPFFSEAGTTVTAGATNQPYASTKGVPGDTSPRVIVVFAPAKLAFGTF